MPGGRIRLNFPMRSTIQAVCCGTKRIMVLAGREGRWKYVEGGLEEGVVAPRREGPRARGWRVLEKGRRWIGREFWWV